MKKTVILAAALMCASAMNAQQLKTFKDSLSYSVGVLWGQNIKQQGITEINSDAMSQAIDKVLAGEETMIDIKSANQMLRKYLNREKEAQKGRNKAEGEAFLKKNAEREGVITMPSGLQYEVMKEGDGPLPKSTDKVNVHYHGTLINGNVFDSSVQRGKPISFAVTGVIKGWVEALQLMPVGSKWKLFIPSNLAYGERGSGGKIGPNAALIFEVELLGID